MPKYICSIFLRYNPVYFYLLFRLIPFVFAYTYHGVFKGEQCVRRGVCFYRHSFDTYSSVHRDFSGFGFIFWVSTNHYTMIMYVFVYIYLCVYIFIRGLFCLGRQEDTCLLTWKCPCTSLLPAWG